MAPENEDLSLKLFIVLSKAAKSLMSRAVSHMKSLGFSALEFSILELLYFKGKFPLQEIGDRVLVTSGGITYNVDKLEAKGYLRRVPCAEDRRIIHAEITPEGRRRFAEAFPPHTRAIRSMMAILPDGEKARMIEALKRLGKQKEVES